MSRNWKAANDISFNKKKISGNRRRWHSTAWQGIAVYQLHEMSRPSGRKSDWVAWSKRQNASRCYFCGRLEGLLVIMCVLFCDLIAVFNIHNTCTVEISTCKLADLLRVVFQRRDPLRFHQQFFEALSFGVFDRMSAERWSKNSNRWRTGGKRVGCWLENELKMEFSSCHPDCCMKLRRCEMLVIVYIYIYDLCNYSCCLMMYFDDTWYAV